MSIEKYIHDSLAIYVKSLIHHAMKVDNIVKHDVMAVKFLIHMPFFISFHEFNFSHVRENRVQYYSSHGREDQTAVLTALNMMCERF